MKIESALNVVVAAEALLIAVLESEVKDLKAKQAYFEAVAARLEALELRITPIQITVEKSLDGKMVNVMP
jgi:hypothetical protein